MSRLMVSRGLTAAALMAIVAMTTQARGAGEDAQQAPRNLQVLPKDWTLQQVQQQMRGFTAALGVECSHCHVSSQDRANDAKPEKLKARKMLQMQMTINNELLKDVGEPPAPGTNKVTCYTCHRGSLKPATGPGGGLSGT
jgi:hypothetical protein